MHDMQLHKCVLGISLQEKITTVVFLCLCMCLFKYAEMCVCVCETRYNIRIFYDFVQRSKEDNMWRQ